MTTCEHCGSERVRVSKQRGNRTQFRCNNCKRYFTVTTRHVDFEYEGAPWHDSDNEIELTSAPHRGEPITVDALLALHGIDLAEWDIERQLTNSWQSTFQGTIIPLYQLKVWLVRKQRVSAWPELRGANVNEEWLWQQPVVHKDEGAYTKRVLIVPDMHVGYSRDLKTGALTPTHDVAACEIVGQVISDGKWDEVVMLGDMLDLAQWSDKFITSPEMYWTTQPALDYLASWIRSWRGRAAKVVYIEGNHEVRLRNAIMKNLAAAYNLRPSHAEPDEHPSYSVPYLLGLKQLEVDWVGDYPKGEHWINSNLRCTHAQKLGARGGITVAKSLEGARCSTIYGHAHRMEAAHVTVHSRNGQRVYGSYCIGTLARTDGAVPSHGAECDWQQGFATVDVCGDYFQVHMHNIYNGKCMYQGEMLEVDGAK